MKCAIQVYTLPMSKVYRKCPSSVVFRFEKVQSWNMFSVLLFTEERTVWASRTEGEEERREGNREAMLSQSENDFVQRARGRTFCATKCLSSRGAKKQRERK